VVAAKDLIDLASGRGQLTSKVAVKWVDGSLDVEGCGVDVGVEGCGDAA